MRLLRAKASGLLVAACVLALAGGFSATAEDVPAAETASPSAEPEAVAAEAPSEPESQSAADAPITQPDADQTTLAVEPAAGTVKSDEPGPCDFAANGQAARLQSVAAIGKASAYDKLMTVPQDDMSASFSEAINPRVRELIAAHPDKDLVICVAGCSPQQGSHIVYSVPSAKRAAAVNAASATAGSATPEFIPTSAELSAAEKASPAPLSLSASGQPVGPAKTQAD